MENSKIFLDSILKDTKENKLLWAQIESDKFTRKYVAMVDIPKTRKYLKLSLNEIILSPAYNYLMVEFNIIKDNKILFHSIGAEKYFPEMMSLINNIKKQIK